MAASHNKGVREVNIRLDSKKTGTSITSTQPWGYRKMLPAKKSY